MAPRPSAPRRSPVLQRRRGRGAVALFSVTLFLSAALMFLIQPMFAKFLLPLLGSTPEVWNSSMLFFQTMLLAGYVYAHESTRRLGVRRQAALHLGVLLVPLLVLPIGVPEGWIPPVEGNPVPWLLGLLAVAIGLPFFVVSATAPLLQRWLAATDHPAAADPYFLYRASNLGSVLGLLGYPFVMEPAMRLGEQGRVWSAGYAVLALLILACAVLVWRSAPASGAAEPQPAPGSAAEPPSTGSGASTRPTARRRLRWIGLAFVPSSLLLGVTAFITTDIAPIPLLWALPLSLYLISFILVFTPGSRAPRLHRLMVFALPGVVLLLLILLLLEVSNPLWLLIPLHLAGFFVAAMVCHGELALDRPAARWLTEFYLLIALGGALGGALNAIVAPELFDSLSEYPLALVLAALCLPRRAPRIPPGPYARWLDLALPIAVGTTVALILSLLNLAGTGAQRPGTMFAFGLASGIALNFIRRPLRFGLTVGAIVLAVVLAAGTDERVLHQERSFFGVYRVTASQKGELHRLIHGTTTHGAQDLSPGRQRTPLSYYHRGGPIGQLLTAVPRRLTARVAIIGLGTGSIACYSRPGERWTFYEIDPTVERIARDPRLFTYLRVCGKPRVVLGDARLSLSRARSRRYGLIVADAFSSDAIPTHLLTREALRLYRSRLRDGGILAFNVSNSYLDLEPVLGALARDADLACMGREEKESEVERAPENDASSWVVMTKRPMDLRAVAPAPRWHHCRRSADSTVWTDDFSNLAGALDLNR